MLKQKPLLDYSVKIKKVKEDIYLVKKNESWKINETTKGIMELCNGENTIEQIVVKISDSYSVSKAIVQEDCEEILYYFISEKLIIID